jgi:hypothetical protein
VTWAPDYTTRALLKSYLRIEDTADDAFIDQWITAVSRNVDDHCGRQFGQVAAPELRQYVGTWDPHLCAWIYSIDDLFDITGFTVVTTAAVAVTSYDLYPLNAAPRGKPYTQLRTTVGGGGRLTMLGPWGWPETPASIPTAMHLQAARLAARRDSPFGVAGAPSEGSELRLLAQLDPDFRTVLKPYVRRWWAR